MTKKNPDSIQILLDAIQNLRNEVARIDRDLGSDREGLERMQMATVANTERINQLAKQLNSIEKRIQDKMADVMAPMVEQTENLTTAIEENKVVVLRDTPWYKRFLKRGGGK